MPYFDGTGPLGRGALSGRGLGPCAGYGYGRGRFGRGFGFGRRQFTRKEEFEMLGDEEKDLLQELEAIKEEKKAFKDAK